MSPEKDPEVSEVAELAPNANNESNSTTRSKLLGCFQVLGAFFVLFNVWFVDLKYRCQAKNSILTLLKGIEFRFWIISKLLCAQLYSFLDRIRNCLDWHNTVLALDCWWLTLRSAL